jgi:hypothetical protein
MFRNLAGANNKQNVNKYHKSRRFCPTTYGNNRNALLQSSADLFFAYLFLLYIMTLSALQIV